MRRPYYPWNLRALLEGRPTVGGLMDQCEENYRYLLRLAPQLKTMESRYVALVDGHIALHLEILEQTRYTTLIHLTHHFDDGAGAHADPDAVLRVYHDALQVEVLDLKQQALPMVREPDMCSLQRKWRINLFLAKWLGYCCRQGYKFTEEQQLEEVEVVEACM